jgi:hypothetical protein
MKKAAKLRFRKLRTADDFQWSERATGIPMPRVISELDRDRRVLLYSLLQSPYLDESHKVVARPSETLVAVAGEARSSAEGLMCAGAADTLAVSFASDERWNSSSIVVEFASGGHPGGELLPVRHACHSSHLGVHIRWASRRTCSEHELLPSSGCPLPNTTFSDQLVDGDWSAYFNSTRKLSPQERTAQLRETADAVAFINGYEHDPTLSAKNSQIAGALRQVFVSAFTAKGHAMYLSTDFEKPAGAFEFCDRDGRHLGEWLFSGRRNGGADRTGGHNIVV